jgi:hypothetical protein
MDRRAALMYRFHIGGVMRQQQPKMLGRALIIPALILWAVWGTGLSANPEQPVQSLMERIEAESYRVRIQYQNASFRLKKNLQGMALEGEEGAGPPTALRTCCTPNIKKIGKAVEKLGKLFIELQSCYDDAGNDDGTIALEFIKADLAEFAWAFGELAKVPDRGSATKILSGVTRDFIKYRDGVAELPRCPAEPQAAEQGEEKKE